MNGDMMIELVEQIMADRGIPVTDGDAFETIQCELMGIEVGR